MGLKTFYRRHEGDVLDWIREPMDVLMSMKASVGHNGFFCSIFTATNSGRGKSDQT